MVIIAYSKEEAIALLDIYDEEFDFGNGPMAIEDTNENEDLELLASLVQETTDDSTEETSKHTQAIVNFSNTAFKENTRKNRHKTNRYARHVLLRDYREGKIDLTGVDEEDYEKYFYKYLNKKAKKTAKLRKSKKHDKHVKERQEAHMIEKAFTGITV